MMIMIVMTLMIIMTMMIAIFGLWWAASTTRSGDGQNITPCYILSCNRLTMPQVRGQNITNRYILSFVAPMNAYDTVHALALDQHGVFTAEQARAAGVKPMALVMMMKRGRLEQLSWGLYRDRGTSITRWTPYATAVLWPKGTTGVLSHETALDLMELSDANPGQIHVTVPRTHRPRRREPPPGVVLHFADLTPEEIGSVGGLPVTTAARTIRDCAVANVGPAIIRQALEDAKRKGWLADGDAAEALTAELTADGKL